MEIPWTDLYTVDEVRARFTPFIQKWKGCNFLRMERKAFHQVFSDDDLVFLTAAKHNKPILLFRGVRNHNPQDRAYIDEYPSSWSYCPKVAKRFGPVLMAAYIHPEHILMDLNYVNRSDSEREVILLPGCFFLIEDVRQFVEVRELTVSELKQRCRDKGIRGYSKLRKHELITLLAPDQSTPSQSTPSQSAPSQSTPGQSTPSQSTPGRSTPGQSTPSQSAPSQSTPAPS